jgi:hypothetical protein
MISSIRRCLWADHAGKPPRGDRRFRGPLPITGTNGKQWSLKVKDRRVAKIIKACPRLAG